MAQLAIYSYEICYRPGAANRNADVLSRMPEETADIVVHAVRSTASPTSPKRVGRWVRQQKMDSDLQLHTWKTQGEPPIISDLSTLSLQF